MLKRVNQVAPALAGLALAAGLVLSSGCTSGEMKASKGNPNAQFLTETAHASTSEVELSQIALKQAGDPQVRQFAQMMVTEHTQANQQLAQLASDKGMKVPMRPDETHAKTATHLRQLSGRQFDQEYMSCMVADHAKQLSKFQDKAALSPDPQVQAWARTQIPVLQKHLDLAREINRSLGGASTLTAGGESMGGSTSAGHTMGDGHMNGHSMDTGGRTGGTGDTGMRRPSGSSGATGAGGR